MSRSNLPPDVADRLRRIRADLGAVRIDQARYGIARIPPEWRSHPEAIAVVGLAECRQERFQSGLDLLQHARLTDPHNEIVLADLADMLWNLGHREQAYQMLVADIERDPREGPMVLLCRLLRSSNRPQLAHPYIKRLESMNIASGEGLTVVAQRLTDLRQYDRAVQTFDRALRAEWSFGRAAGKLFAMLYGGADPLDVRRATEADVAAPMLKKLGTAAPRPASASAGLGPSPAPLAGRKLRIGYVSADIRRHVVMRFFSGLLEHHDRSKVFVVCYSDTGTPDDLTEWARSRCDLFRDTARSTDATIADQIRADRIDILVDLSGLTEGNRLEVFARHPAAVQVTYLGYPATTGLPQMDFRLTDRWADPEDDSDPHYVEQVIRLPRCAWAYTPLPGVETEPTVLPCRDPAMGGVFSFGSLNLFTKVNQPSMRLWASAVAQCPTPSRLYMTDRNGVKDDPEAFALLSAEVDAAGLAQDRLVLAGWVPDPKSHLSRLSQVDLMLDPLSYNGTTTTAEALFAGLPTLTLPGRSHVSRVGRSLLRAVGLSEFVADSEQDFIDKALRHAADPSRLEEIRRELPRTIRQTELGDPASLARAMEDAFAHMLRLKYPGV